MGWESLRSRLGCSGGGGAWGRRGLAQRQDWSLWTLCGHPARPPTHKPSGPREAQDSSALPSGPSAVPVDVLLFLGLAGYTSHLGIPGHRTRCSDHLAPTDASAVTNRHPAPRRSPVNLCEMSTCVQCGRMENLFRANFKIFHRALLHAGRQL